YPPEDEFLETDLPFVSLWYAVGGEYAEHNGGWQMTVAETPRSVIVASEPLTSDHSSWLEVPEYSMLTAELGPDRLDFETRDLGVWAGDGRVPRHGPAAGGPRRGRPFGAGACAAPANGDGGGGPLEPGRS